MPLLDVEEFLLRVRKTLSQSQIGPVAFLDATARVTQQTSYDSVNETADILAELRQLNHELKICAVNVGNLPPSPPTLRAEIGRLLVRAVRRMLFWYIPPVRQLHAVLLKRCERETLILDRLLQLIGEEALGRTAPAYTPVFHAGSVASSIAILRALPSASLTSLSFSDTSEQLIGILDEIVRVLRPGGLVTLKVLDARVGALHQALTANGIVPNHSQSSSTLTGCKPT